jgi:hypothetical protein
MANTTITIASKKSLAQLDEMLAETSGLCTCLREGLSGGNELSLGLAGGGFVESVCACTSGGSLVELRTHRRRVVFSARLDLVLEDLHLTVRALLARPGSLVARTEATTMTSRYQSVPTEGEST